MLVYTFIYLYHAGFVSRTVHSCLSSTVPVTTIHSSVTCYFARSVICTTISTRYVFVPRYSKTRLHSNRTLWLTICFSYTPRFTQRYARKNMIMAPHYPSQNPDTGVCGAQIKKNTDQIDHELKIMIYLLYIYLQITYSSLPAVARGCAGSICVVQIQPRNHVPQ